MYPAALMQARLRAAELLNDKSECVRTAAALVLKNLPEMPLTWIDKTQVEEDDVDE